MLHPSLYPSILRGFPRAGGLNKSGVDKITHFSFQRLHIENGIGNAKTHAYAVVSVRNVLWLNGAS